MSEFKSQVRKDKIKQPTQNGFSVEKWNAAWSKVKQHSGAEDASLYNGGIFIYNRLSDIRNEISELHKKAPTSNKMELVKLYIGVSNREFSIISKHEAKHQQNIFSLTTSKNRLNDEVTIQGATEASIDGITSAIKYLISEKSNITEVKKSPTGIIDFIQIETHLSSLYNFYESCWHCLLWGDYHFSTEEDSSGIYYKIVQHQSEYEISREISQIRRQKLTTHTSMNAHPLIEQLFANDYCLLLVKEHKKKKPIAKNINLPEKIKSTSLIFRQQSMNLPDSIPSDFLLDKHNDYSFSIMDIMEVFRLLSTLAQSASTEFPDNTIVLNKHHLMAFCPSIKKTDLMATLNKSTNIPPFIINAIIDFLSFTGKSSHDIWCHPLIKINNNEFIFSTAALLSPNFIRITENWLVEMDVSLGKKGKAYEDKVLSAINSALVQNSIITSYDKATSLKITIDNTEEEIDLLMRIGDKVILGEIKSIITTDSPISYFRTRQTLEHAANQTKRKSIFIKNSLAAVFKRLKWNFNPSANYKILPVIVTSNKICVGSKISDIPVCDEILISKFCSENTVPLMTMPDNSHAAWFTIYKDQHSAEQNIESYLANPPQITQRTDDFRYLERNISLLKNQSEKLKALQLAYSGQTPEQLLKRTYIFELNTIDDINEKIKEVDLTI